MGWLFFSGVTLPLWGLALGGQEEGAARQLGVQPQPRASLLLLLAGDDLRGRCAVVVVVQVNASKSVPLLDTQVREPIQKRGKAPLLCSLQSKCWCGLTLQFRCLWGSSDCFVTSVRDKLNSRQE